jgi:hypothetical protein
MRGDTYAEFSAPKPMTNLAQNNDEVDGYTINTTRGSKYKITVEVKGHPEGNLAFGIKDLDVRDLSYDGDIVDSYEGPYAEGIELLSGFNYPIHFPYQQEGNEYSLYRAYVSTRLVDGRLRIYPNGSVYQSDEFEDESKQHFDNATFYSGFMTSASMAGTEFYWTGTNCGTMFTEGQSVTIRQTHNEGGTVTTTAFGEKITLGEEDITTHLIGSTPVYDYTPLEGYHVVSVTVNGQKVEIAKDYKYQFSNLVYSPLEDIPYSIDIVYAKDSVIPKVVPNPRTGIAAIGGFVIAAIGVGSYLYIKKKNYSE